MIKRICVWAVVGLSAAVAFRRETVDLAGEWGCADGSRTITKADGGAGAKDLGKKNARILGKRVDIGCYEFMPLGLMLLLR